MPSTAEVARAATVGEQNKIIAVVYTALQECRELARGAVTVTEMDDALAKIDRIATVASDYIEEMRQHREVKS